MKRKNNSCLIEEIDPGEASKKGTIKSNIKKIKMPSPKEWLTRLQSAEKTSQIHNNKQKVHYKFCDNTEMVEEYSMDTFVVLRRAWKKPGKFGGDGNWDIEIGDPEPVALNPLDSDVIRESNDQPIGMRRNTRISLEWRVRNLPYPIETYSVAANAEEKCIIVKTTNKKYYKKFPIPELERIGIVPVQANIEYTHKFNTLIITYKKPKELLEMEKTWVSELKKLETNKDDFADCKPS